MAEASATELSKQRDPKGYKAQTRVAKDGGSVAKAARKQLEGKLGRSVISSAKASDYLLPTDDNDEECRMVMALSQQVEQEMIVFLGIIPYTPYLCIRFLIHMY